MIKQDELIKGLKHLLERKTLYSNQFPRNCGYIWPSGYLSFDCIGLIKSPINYPKIFYKTKPAGFYCQPGKVIPDTTINGIMQLCKDRTTDFRKIQPGEVLRYQDADHGAWYVGEFKDESGTVNVVECCDDFVGSGVTTSYVDQYGNRYDHKGGTTCGRWIDHGKLNKYISYKEEKKKSVTAIAKEVIAGKWGNYPERKKKLEAAGYNYKKIQAKVNEMLKDKE